MGTARLFGDDAALKALKEGEESGIKDYESVLDEGAEPELQNVFGAIMAREQQHVQALDRMMSRR
jgi:rubrerythrin